MTYSFYVIAILIALLSLTVYLVPRWGFQVIIRIIISFSFIFIIFILDYCHYFYYPFLEVQRQFIEEHSRSAPLWETILLALLQNTSRTVFQFLLHPVSSIPRCSTHQFSARATRLSLGYDSI